MRLHSVEQRHHPREEPSNTALIAGINVAAQFLLSASTALTKGHHLESDRVMKDINCALVMLKKIMPLN